MLLGSLTSAPFITLAGVIYPAYSTWKTLQAGNQSAMTRWLQYWMIFALFSTFEFAFDMVGAYLPLYYEAKLAFMLWLSTERFQGATVLCQKYVEPLLLKNQSTIDEQIAFASSRLANFKVEDVGALVTWLTEMAGKNAPAAVAAPAAKPAAAAPAKPAAAPKEAQKEAPQEPDETHETVSDDAVDVSDDAKKDK